jgi:hypothetical protein
MDFFYYITGFAAALCVLSVLCYLDKPTKQSFTVFIISIIVTILFTALTTWVFYHPC